MAPLSTNALAHFLHPAHKLTELNDDTPYRCDGCKIIGNGTRFSCVSCQFDLHVYCAKCPTKLTSTTNHPHTMSLVVHKPKPNQTEPCQICQKPIQGLVFECKSCSFLVHPLCVSRNTGLNQASALPCFSSTAQSIGQKVAVELAADYIYDTITKDNDEELTTDSDALGDDEDEEPTTDSDASGDDEESGRSLYSIMRGIVGSIFPNTQSVGEQVAVEMATDYICDTVTKDEDEKHTADSEALGNNEDEEPTADSEALGNDEDEVPTADSEALGNDEDEVPTADSDTLGNEEESCSLFDGFKSLIEIFSSSFA